MNHSPPSNGAPVATSVMADEVTLRSLHAALPLASVDPDFGDRFDRFVGRLREARHPLGIRDLRTVHDTGLDFEVDLGDSAGCELYYGLVRRAFDRTLFLAILRPGDITIDVGAGFGLFALPAAARLAASGTVYALEADPAARALLEANARRNQLTERLQSVGIAASAGDEFGTPFSESPPAANGHATIEREDTASRTSRPRDGRPTEINLVAAVDGLGVEALDVLRIADLPTTVAVSVLRATATRLRHAADPLILWQLETARAASRVLVRAALDDLADAGFAPWIVDRAARTVRFWQSDALDDTPGSPEPKTLVLVHHGGARESLLRTVRDAAEIGHDLSGAIESIEGAPATAAALTPMLTAVAVSALRDLDRMASALHARLVADSLSPQAAGVPDATAAPHLDHAARKRIADLQLAVDREIALRKKAEGRAAETAWEASRRTRAEAQMAELEREVSRLAVFEEQVPDLEAHIRYLEDRVRQFDEDVRQMTAESEQRLREARALRREVKDLRSRREVAVGQWLRSAARRDGPADAAGRQTDRRE